MPVARPRLSQVIAVERLIKQNAHTELTQAHRDLAKPGLLAGLSRTYQPRDELGDPLPPQSTRVQLNTTETLRHVADALVKLFDVTATKDWGNLSATADVVVDGQVLITAAPPTYLLFLEKQLTDLRTFVGALPVLDLADEWYYDAPSATYRTPPVQTTSKQKVPRNHVKAEATDKHPAQVDVYYEDVPVGDWRLVKYSGALPAETVNRLVERVDAFYSAVKYAREAANATEVQEQHVGRVVLDYLFELGSSARVEP